MTWEFRYRGPRMVETVQLETVTDQEAEARKLAQKHLDSLNTPAANFIWVRKAVAQRSVDYPDLLEEFAPELLKTRAAKTTKGSEDAEDVPKKALAVGGRIGA
jgi:hypothetical protein